MFVITRVIINAEKAGTVTPSPNKPVLHGNEDDLRLPGIMFQRVAIFSSTNV
jgi:hypothetical protein